MERTQWLSERRKGIGGSDVGAICGLDKYRSPIMVYLDKIDENPASEEETEFTYWGKRMEPILIEEFEKRTGKKVSRIEKILQHPEHDFMLANVDGWIEEEQAVLECKTASEYVKGNWSEGSIPDSYLLQVQHYMAVTGAQKAYIVALIGGNHFLYKEIERDDELITSMIEIEKEFWQRVIDRNPPAVDGSESSSEFLKKMYPVAEETEIELPDNITSLVTEREELKKQETEIKTAIAEKENLIRQILGASERGRNREVFISLKNCNQSRVDSEKLKTEYPEIYRSCLKNTSYRRLQIKKIGG